MKQNPNIIITGEWDGQPIWRRVTPTDRLQWILDKVFSQGGPVAHRGTSEEEFDQHDCKQEKCGVCLEYLGEAKV